MFSWIAPGPSTLLTTPIFIVFRLYGEPYRIEQNFRLSYWPHCLWKTIAPNEWHESSRRRRRGYSRSQHQTMWAIVGVIIALTITLFLIHFEVCICVSESTNTENETIHLSYECIRLENYAMIWHSMDNRFIPVVGDFIRAFWSH